MQVADVGGGTGFCTQGVVKTVSASNVTLVDQSPHQLEKARTKPDLQGVTIMEVGHFSNRGRRSSAVTNQSSSGQRAIAAAFSTRRMSAGLCNLSPDSWSREMRHVKGSRLDA